jgi:hypothetical protein
MPPYPVLCSTPECGKPAIYKIASKWSDGVTHELKTYGLACADHVAFWFERARQRQAACGLAAGETLDPPAILRRDESLQRDAELESQLVQRNV